MPDRDAMRGPAVLTLIFVALSLVSTGCKVSIEQPKAVFDSGLSTAMSASAEPLPQYDVAISAIDFDPPLGRDVTVAAPSKLIAAVENRGASQLTRLIVEAQVTSRKGDFSARDTASVDKLSPGETRVVEFDRASLLSGLPRSGSFSIKVSVNSSQVDPALPKPTRELIVRVTGQ